MKKLGIRFFRRHMTKLALCQRRLTFGYFRTLFMPGDEKTFSESILATKQRIPGLGNGVLQDILFHARIHPKRKMDTLTIEEYEKLYGAVKDTLLAMTVKGRPRHGKRPVWMQRRLQDYFILKDEGNYRVRYAADKLKRKRIWAGAYIIVPYASRFHKINDEQRRK